MTNAALITLATTQTVTGAGAGGVPFDTEQYDDASFYSSGQPTRFTVPAGVSRVRVGCSVVLNNIDTGLTARATIAKNASLNYPGAPIGTASHGGSAQQPRICLASGQLPVVEGDYFEVSVQVAGETSYEVVGSARTNFWIEDAS